MKSLPRVHIAQLPTSVELLPRLSQVLKGPQIFVKRDDLTGLAFGGNKTRKLEFLVADAQTNDAKMLITAGAAQSNHCRQTAAAAARSGMACTLVLTSPKGQVSDAHSREGVSGNLLLDHLLGAQIVWAEPEKREQVLEGTFISAQEAGKHPYLIPYGGSNPVGASAYVFAIRELLEQKQEPDWIVFASSSGGTQAGMLLGAKLFGYSGHILGISVDEPKDILVNRVAGLASDTAEYLEENVRISPEDVLVNSDYLGGGYGVMDEPEREAIRLFARTEGLLLDPVYTGRAAAGMIDLIQKGFFGGREQSVLFWHTGGTPALFADQYQDSI